MEQEKFDALLKEITRKQRTVAKANKTLNELITLRNDNCQHTETENHEYYNGGGYDYTDYTEYWTTCKVCGASSERVRKDHGSYA